MDQRQFNNGTSKLKALDTDGDDVTSLLRTLPRVQAPDNFDFGVKAKIARRKQATSGLTPFLKLAAPFGLVLLIGVIVVFYGLRPSGPDVAVIADTPAVTETNFVPPATEIPASPAAPVSSPEVAPRVETAPVPERASVAPATRGPVRRSSNSTATSSGGGSFDISLGSAKAKLPPGFESAEPRSSGINSDAASGSPVREALGVLGVTSSFANGGWQVSSVAENSVASRGKVMAGDVITAIGGQQLKSDSTIKGNITTLTVRRDGKTVSLKIGN